jgi:hypothetical protein
MFPSSLLSIRAPEAPSNHTMPFEINNHLHVLRRCRSAFSPHSFPLSCENSTSAFPSSAYILRSRKTRGERTQQLRIIPPKLVCKSTVLLIRGPDVKKRVTIAHGEREMELRRYCPLVQEILFAVQEASQLRDKGSAPVRPTGPQDALQIEFSMFTIARKRFTVTLPHFFEVAKCCSVHLHCCTVSNICLIPSLSFTIPCKAPDS